MRRHPVVLVQEYGMLGQVWLAQWCGGPGLSLDEFKKVVRKNIEQSGDLADLERRFHYVVLEDAVAHLKLDDARRRRERIELLQYMLDRKEIVGNLANGDDVSTIVRDGLDALWDSFPEKKQIEWIRRVEAVLDGKARLVIGSSEEDFVLRMRYYLEDRRRQIERHLPESARSAPPPPWKQVQTLIRYPNFSGSGGMVAPLVHDDSLLVVAVRGGERDGESEAFRVPLNPVGTPRSLGKVRACVHDALWSWELGPACAGGGYYFVCAGDDGHGEHAYSVLAVNHGIIAFPLAGGEIRRIETKGLPSDHVQTMAELDGKLYMALEGGYLVRCDLHGGPCDVLASSRRKQHLSPFDDGSVFSVPYLAADPKRRRLLCFINIPSRTDYIGARRWTKNGLWQYDLVKGSFRQILQINPFSDGGIVGGSEIHDDQFLLWHHNWALRVDLKTDKANMVFANSSRCEILPGLKTGAAPYKNLPDSWGPYAEADGWLWSIWDPFARLSKDGKVEVLPSPDPKGRNEGRFQYLRTPADSSRLIVGDHTAMWLLMLKDPRKP